MSTAVVTAPAQLPTKWDIIPIHASDVAAYKRCRRYWDWTSPSRNNLRRRVDIHGVKMELWFGTGIHYALEMYYDPVLRRDPVEAFKTWYKLQWDGGSVDASWLDRTYDIKPQLVGGRKNQYKIRGLRQLLPNIEVVQEQFEAHYELGVGMLNYYKEWAPKHDDFVVVAAESVFSIPLGFEAVDRREESPNYGKKIEVHARGKRDTVIYWPEWDKYGIKDHKTAARVDEDYFLKLENDEQITQYLWATMKEKDAPWSGQLIDKALMTALRKNVPGPPEPTYNGSRLSLAKDAATTAELFEAALESNDVWAKWFVNEPKAQAYLTYLIDRGDEMFIMRGEAYRNKHEIKAFEKRLVQTAREMLNPKTYIYPNPTGSWLCTGCAFRAPCLAADDGSDWKGMLSDAYETNRER